MEPSLPGLDVPVQLRGTIIGFARLLPYLRLRPRWHAIEVAYLLRADNVSRPLPFRLHCVNQPVISTPNVFSTPRPILLACTWAHLGRSTLRCSTPPVLRPSAAGATAALERATPL